MPFVKPFDAFNEKAVVRAADAKRRFWYQEDTKIHTKKDVMLKICLR